jgi:hypothetical protein
MNLNAGDQNRTSAMAAKKVNLVEQMKPETHVDLEEMRSDVTNCLRLEGEQQWCKIADPQATPERLLPPPTISDPFGRVFFPHRPGVSSSPDPGVTTTVVGSEYE